MNAPELLRKGLLCATAALCVSRWLGAQDSLAAQDPNQDEEVQMSQVFNELKAKGEIVESSPLYDQLRPVGLYPCGAAAIQPPVQVLSGS